MIETNLKNKLCLEVNMLKLLVTYFSSYFLNLAGMCNFLNGKIKQITYINQGLSQTSQFAYYTLPENLSKP